MGSHITTEDKIKIGISSCLLGEKVRFDASHKHDPYLTETLGQYFEWVPVCPEYEVGMGIPREAVRLVGEHELPRMVGSRSGKDWTETMNSYAKQRVKKLLPDQLCGFILKSRSPSCGMERVTVYQEKGPGAKKGCGLFASALMKEYPLLPVEEEGRLNDPKIRENFIVRVFAYARLQRDLIRNFSRGRLVAFHTATKLLIMAHSPKHYSEMGQLVAHAKAFNSTELKTRYTQLFMEAFKLRATTKKNYNVLQHIFGFFSDRLSGDEKEDILGCLKDYKDELVPLIVPVTLLKHYVQKFSVDYILGQTYLNPSPKELMLRNHV